MNLGKAISWGLAVVLAVQPALAMPCVCMARRDAAPKQAAGHECCRAKASAPRIGNGMCPCCQGPCLCAAKDKSREPIAPPSPPQRAAADELAFSAICLPVVLTDALVAVRLAWESSHWPVVFATAPERCTALCRWLF